MKRLPILLLLLASGCATRVGDFTLISTKNVEISRVDLKKVPFQRNVRGGHGQLMFLFIPFGGPPNLKEAVDNALENGKGDFMTSAVVYEHGWSILLFSWSSIEIKGDVGNSLGSGSRDLSEPGGGPGGPPPPP